jgi:glycerol-3-phosphate cytidylyltransferase
MSTLVHQSSPTRPIVCYTAGVWDLLHRGHLNMIRRSREMAGEGGLLVVGVVTDAGTEAYKGIRPAQDERTRLLAVAALPEVGAAFLQPGTDPSPVIRAVAACGACPDVMTHGDDWDRLKEGHETLEELGIAFRTIPYTPGISSTMLREAAG